MAVRASTEQRLLDAADELLFSQGIAATAVDEILVRAGVSTATLYRAYGSKTALVAAALERRHRRWMTTWDGAVARAPDARGRLLAVFDALEDFRRTATGARWCAFLGTAAEYASPPEEVAAALRLDTDALRAGLRALAEPVVGPHADTLAEELLLLVSGDLAMRLRDPRSSVHVARSVADAVVDRRLAPAAGPTG